MVEYKVIEQDYWPAISLTELEIKLNKLSTVGFKISHVIPGFQTNSGTIFFPKIILEREIKENDIG